MKNRNEFFNQHEADGADSFKRFAEAYEDVANANDCHKAFQNEMKSVRDKIFEKLSKDDQLLSTAMWHGGMFFMFLVGCIGSLMFSTDTVAIVFAILCVATSLDELASLAIIAIVRNKR